MFCFQIVVNALIMAVPSIINVLLVCLVFWLIFAIMGVQFFSGKFWKCVDSTGEKVSKEIVKTKDDCNSTMYSWQNSKINFDHVGNAFLALFQIVCANLILFSFVYDPRYVWLKLLR